MAFLLAMDRYKIALLRLLGFLIEAIKLLPVLGNDFESKFYWVFWISELNCFKNYLPVIEI